MQNRLVGRRHCAQVWIYLDGTAVIRQRGSRRDRGGLNRLITPEEVAAAKVHGRPMSPPGDFAPPSNRCCAIVLRQAPSGR